MTKAQAIAEIFYTAFKTLEKKEKDAILEKIIEDDEFREDLLDIAIIKKRRKESSRPLNEYLLEAKKRGLS